MEIPPEFKIFAQRFYSFLFNDIENEDQLIAFAIEPFSDPISRARLRSYLDEITDSKVASENLRELWWSSPADTIFNDGEELRKFIRAVRDRL